VRDVPAEDGHKNYGKEVVCCGKSPPCVDYPSDTLIGPVEEVFRGGERGW